MSAKAVKKLTLGYCPIGNGDSIAPFDQVFNNAQDISVKGIRDVDAVIFWGGTDIHPSYYKEKMHIRSQANKDYSSRDIFEWKAMNYCKIHKIPMIGVCRGAQFMCAFTGGKLIQHISGHSNGSHNVITTDGDKFAVTTCHHQMLDLRGTNHELLAWTPEPLSRVYQGETELDVVNKDGFKEPEIVYFPEFKGLAIQGHPEWADLKEEFVQETNRLVVEYLFNEKWK
jgi:gamma-glutamyl-gamma-aminobutyrate hydrolase PuuD